MSAISNFTRTFINFIESSPISFSLWLGTFVSLILTRLLIESWIGGFSNHSIEFLFSEFTHTFLFFLLSYLLFLLLLSNATKTSPRKIVSVLLWGFLIILIPPIIDHIVSHGSGFWSFYKFDSLQGLWTRFFTFFGDAPSIGITYGVRVEVFFSLIFFFLYILIKRKMVTIALLWTFLAYILFFILGTFPSWITIFTWGFLEGFLSISPANIAQMFLTPENILSRAPGELINALNIKMSIIYGLILSLGIPLLSLIFSPKKTIALLRNARLPQSIYHSGLLIIGSGLGVLFSMQPFSSSLFDVLALLILLISVEFSWFASVIVNDLFDTEIDSLTNQNRPLIQNVFSKEEYKIIGWVFFLSSILLAGIALPIAPIILLFYQGLAWIYSAYPFRLKRFPFIATFLSAIASILILFLGYIAIYPTGSLSHIPENIIILLIIGYTLSLPVKDLKDIEGDKKDKVYTLPMLFGETKGRLIIATGVFFSFILSVWAFNDFSLLFWAIFLGGTSFWVIATSNQWKNFRIHPQNLPILLLFFTALYGLVIISKLF